MKEKHILNNIVELSDFLWKREQLFSKKEKWFQFWVSIDTINDANEAIEFYKSLNNFDAFNGGYLYLYGLLQALFLQQDAIKYLSKSLLGIEIKINKNNNYDLFKIRELRNSSIGHPTNRNNSTSFHFISRPTVNKNGFTMINEYKNLSKHDGFNEVEILSIIDIQDKLIYGILKDIKTKLEDEIEEHKEKFKGKLLSDFFSESIFNSFVILKSFRIYPNRYLFEYKYIKNTFSKIREEFKVRYGNFEYYEDLKQIIYTIDSLFERIDRITNNNIEDKLGFRLIIENLENHFYKLQEIAVETDKEFQLKPQIRK